MCVCSSCLVFSWPAEFHAGQTTVFQSRYKHTYVKLLSFPFSTAIDLHLMRLMLRLIQDPKDSQKAKSGKDYCMCITTRHLLLGNWNSVIVSCCC